MARINVAALVGSIIIFVLSIMLTPLIPYGSVGITAVAGVPIPEVITFVVLTFIYIVLLSRRR